MGKLVDPLSIHGLGKWYTKFRTGKFRPGIAVTICTNRLNLPKKRPRRPEPGIKDGFEEMDHEFPFGIFRPEKKKNRTTFSNVPLLPFAFARLNSPFPFYACHAGSKSRVPFTFQPDFPED